MLGYDAGVRAHITQFSLNYTFWLNMLFGGLAAYLFVVNRSNPMSHDHSGHGHGYEDVGAAARMTKRHITLDDLPSRPIPEL